MTLSRREKIMIIGGLILVSLTAYIFYFFMPYQSGISDATKRLNGAKSQIGLLNTKKTMSAQLKNEIASLSDELKGSGSAIPTGVDHASILLYLQGLTDGRAEKVAIAIPKEPELQNGFLLQAVTVDFQTSYSEMLQIIGGLKENKLYNRVTFINAAYTPPAAQDTANGTTVPEATEAPSLTAGSNVINVHIELNFYALPPTAGQQPAEPLPPSNGDRESSLFPKY